LGINSKEKKMSNPNKYKIYLSEPEGNALKNISRNGQSPAKKILHAQMLLLSDQDHAEGGRTDSQISEALGVHPYTVAGVGKRDITPSEPLL
jgi:hypothetical protein